MPLLDTATGRIAYDARGSGPAVVLLPSGAHHRRDYDALRALLPDRFRSIGIDWPGHGESPAGSRAADEPHLADLVEQILDQLAPDGAVLVGNSIGGNVAARTAARRPALVRGLMLVDSGGFEPPRLHSRMFCALMGRPWFARAVYPGFSRWYMRSRTSADRRARTDAIATTRTAAGLTAVTQMWHSFTLPEHDLRGLAGRITAPTVVVWGRHDPVLPLAAARNAHALIPGSSLVVIDSGHSPHTSDPASVAAHLVPLLDAAFPAKGPSTTRQ
ncbi:alpha/beta hydrolase fold protein [Actinoplanes sp. SE50]|uniref:alpha/beta fold hydrolase n=1 Tax=unclassified Actinoplanes TaxID=2626549 RepID=UPI00023EC7D6|nr:MULTISPECIES: alpha/beta hydrolase [unclassified Actinoplanes]AEV84726.1 alpha/beta hydrolase fold protein [Actinoplanes sp. SE50/110]ATO83118.1 alpha/beta hydrolase fold protein [Actinoplanes sp. SE50]SLM00525.1 alpha/beta hydrolase fold protein [Actinoplanes sp. SE50/110]